MEDEIKIKKYRGLIEDFLKSEEKELLLQELDSFDRKILHEICDSLNLAHDS